MLFGELLLGHPLGGLAMFVFELGWLRQRERLLAHCCQSRGFLLLKAPLVLLLYLFTVFLKVHQACQAHSLEFGDKLLHGLVQVETRADKHEGDTGRMSQDCVINVDFPQKVCQGDPVGRGQFRVLGQGREKVKVKDLIEIGHVLRDRDLFD